MKRQLGWKWLDLSERDGKIVSHYDGSPWEPKIWREVPAPTEPCVGLNDSPTIAQARSYHTEGKVLARTEHKGACITSHNKTTSQKMRLLHAWFLTPEAGLYDARASHRRWKRNNSWWWLLSEQERQWQLTRKRMKRLF